MTEAGLRAREEHISELLRRLRETKDPVTVACLGRAVARPVPVEDLASRKAAARKALAEIEELA